MNVVLIYNLSRRKSFVLSEKTERETHLLGKNTKIRSVAEIQLEILGKICAIGGYWLSSFFD